MRERDRLYSALALVTTVALGCGGGTHTTGSGGQGGSASNASSTTSSSSGSSSSSSSSGTGGMACPPGDSTVFALTKLDWGEGNAGQWKSVGFNLDGIDTTTTFTNLCQPNDGAMASMVFPDGNQGIDNSFGENLLPTLLGVDPTWVSDINTGITNGTFNVLLEVDCLPQAGDAPVLTTKFFGATPLGSMPKFDGTDKWPVEPELLTNPKDPESSSIVFPASSVKGNTFDTGKNQTMVLTIPVNSPNGTTSIKLTLYAAELTMTLSADRKSATGGMIGGVLNTQEFAAEIQKVAYLYNLCGSSLIGGLITQVEQASDILADGTQDTTKTCDGISIGFTFEMSQAQIGIVGPAQTAGMTCPSDGGV